MSVLSSVDNMLASAATNGLFVRSYFDVNLNTPTAATITSGYVRIGRYSRVVTIPTLGAGITGLVFPTFQMVSNLSATCVGGLETSLGTCTANGGTGSYASGSSMPTKTVAGVSTTTATQLAFAVVNTVMVGAGTYTLTITYTNQSGTGSRTCTITVPNVATVGSAFLLNPHLQAGDTGIRSISNITLTGTTGVVEIKGLLVLGTSMYTGASIALSPDPLTVPHLMWPAVATDTIAFYVIGAAGVGALTAVLVGVADS